ncbi:hypothetical protein B0H14DRAFT_3131567 [Mycena olivaceomarginata]|nr:hypothetical protein B0H14DRAFT_3131567 [Mycena olivaceomarginata]
MRRLPFGLGQVWYTPGDAALRPTSNGHRSFVRTSINSPVIGTGCTIVPSSVPIACLLFLPPDLAPSFLAQGAAPSCTSIEIAKIALDAAHLCYAVSPRDSPSSRRKASGGARAPRRSANVEVPLERRVDILARPGAGHQEFLERSFVPFQGAQYGDCRHRLPLPDRQSPIDATTYLAHMLEDVVDRISAGAQRMGGSFGQRISQAFFPKRRVVVPEDFEVGDRLLDFGGFLAAGEVQQPPLHPPILPSDAELSEFPSTYHFGSEARARFEQEYQGSIAHRHADGRVTSH